MKLGRIVIFEVIIFAAVLISAMVILEVVPFLQASEENTPIGLYKSRSYARTPITISNGASIILPFNYSSFDPAIIILELSFQTCEKPGYLSIYCNYRNVASIFINPDNPSITFNLISVAGIDWAELPTAMFGRNELLFESESPNGYEGILTYQITLKGSR